MRRCDAAACPARLRDALRIAENRGLRTPQRRV
jgi:hypothetical protein